LEQLLYIKEKGRHDESSLDPTCLGSGTSSSKPHSIEGAALITKLVGEKGIRMQT